MKFKNRKIKQNNSLLAKWLDLVAKRNKILNRNIGRIRLSKTHDTNRKILKRKILNILGKFMIFFTVFVLLGLLFVVLGILTIISAYSRDLPDVDQYLANLNKTLGKETIIVDRNGTEVYRLRGDIVSKRFTLDETPPLLQWAFKAAEDKYFDDHNGLDVFGLTRALLCIGENYLNGKRSYDGCPGGSTITQQLIKNVTGNNATTVQRKVQEAVLAMNLESEFGSEGKNKILEYYMNIVSMGGVYTGAKVGAKNLFGKEMKDLTLAEMCFIAGIPQRPSVLSPRGSGYNIEASKSRAKYVLNNLYEIRDKVKRYTGVELTDELYKQTLQEIENIQFQPDQKIDIKAPHYVNTALEDIEEKKIFADKSPDGSSITFLKSAGYKIVLALDLPTQELLQKYIYDGVSNPEFQEATYAQNAAGVIMDPNTGEVLAMVGSKDFFAKSDDKRFAPEFNAATAYRQPGSSLKPILYGAMFTKGFNPSSVLPDIPMNLSGNRNATGIWPYNYNRRFGSYTDTVNTGKADFISVRHALKFSLNMPAAAAYHIAGSDTMVDFYTKLSGNPVAGANFGNPASVIGAASVRVIDQAQAYSTIAAGGIYRERKYILEIYDDKGNLVYNNKEVVDKRVLDERYAFLINDISKEPIHLSRPFYVQLRNEGIDFRSKTGTSDGEKGPPDIYIYGYTPDRTIVLWGGNSCSGYECPLKPTALSDHLNRYILEPFLAAYKDKLGKRKFTPPSGVTKVSLCSLTGNIMTEECLLAGGKEVQDYVVGKARDEYMIDVAMVVPCPVDYKLARQVDMDLGIAEKKGYVNFHKMFPQKFISDQILSYLQSKGMVKPEQECDIERTINPTQINIISPNENAVFVKGTTINLNYSITSDIPLQKKELFVNSIFYTNLDNLSGTVDISTEDLSLGSNTITIVVTEKDGKEVEKSVNIIIQSNNITPTTTPTPTPTVTILLPLEEYFNWLVLSYRVHS